MNIKFNQNTNEENKVERKKLSSGYIVLLTGMFVISMLSLAMTYKTYSRYNKEEYKSYTSTDTTPKKAEESVVDETPKEIGNEEVPKVHEETEEATVQTVAKVEPIKKEEVLDFAIPLKGEIIKESSIDEVVYWETLDVWKIHEGVDIASEEGTSVKAVESGKVVGVKTDPIFGKLILINHGQSYVSIYCNLDDNVSVKNGDTVKKGQTIGKVGCTAYGEAKEESHLHFEMMKDSTYIDPATVISFN